MTKAPLSNINARIHGLYAITPDEADTERLCAKVEAALQGGVRLLQYRNKLADAQLRVWQATALQQLCRAHDATFIINDYVDLCAQLDADGVHLGGTDGDIAQARATLGADKIIGASCYNQLDRAYKAQAAGANYVAFGACFATSTKPDAAKADLSLFHTLLDVPKVAIGGITLENAQQVTQAGAQAIAVINALFGADDVKLQAEKFIRLL